MTRQRSTFYCSACQVSLMQWEGRCPKCGAWNTVEERPVVRSGNLATECVRRTISEVSPDGEDTVSSRLVSGVAAWDWVLGGGIARGSVVLLGGEPGVGKSTLALQLIGSFAQQGVRCLYASGEENAAQIATRARRLGADGSCALLCDGDVSALHGVLEQGLTDVMVIDSIQAFADPTLNLSRYSATYLRTIVEDLGTRAKQAGSTLLLLSQINKEGALLGPKAIEHLVDVVVFFEGDRDTSRRVLRVSKNRYGKSPEYAALDMHASGLRSAGEAGAEQTPRSDRPGRVRYPALFGSRVELVEVQALVSDGCRDTPARPLAEGLDPGRLSLIVAIIDKALGTDLYRRQILLQVTGGVHLVDPAADLAVAVALLSSYWERALPLLWTAYGELSLLGEVRRVRDDSSRYALAHALGFERVVRPGGVSGNDVDLVDDLLCALYRLGLGDCTVRAVG